MDSMFAATNFNRPLNNWNVSNVVTMEGMFNSNAAFNQNINSWNVSNVQNMAEMFAGATGFSQPLNNWNTSSVTTMAYMFDRATAFNQPLNSWNVSNVVTMEGMFKNATNFNQNINSRDTSKVSDMDYMFNEATGFNQPLHSWNISNVSNMDYMFYGATKFNQPLSGWDTSSVVWANSMFLGASAFNQDLSAWSVTKLMRAYGMFDNTALSTYNYNEMLDKWSQQNLAVFAVFGANPTKYGGCEVNAAAGIAGRALLQTKGWIITDGGQAPCSDAFITTWRTTTANEWVQIPTMGGGYSFTVDRGDGTTGSYYGTVGHTYATAGDHQVSIRGSFPRIYINNNAYKDKLISVDQWGDMAWTSMENAFYGCTNLAILATDAPDLSNVTNMYGMF